MYSCIKEATMTKIERGRNFGKFAIQQKIIENFSDMDMKDIQEFLKTRALCVTGYSEAINPESGETILYLGIEMFGKATYADCSVLKGKTRWNHIVIDGQRIF